MTISLQARFVTVQKHIFLIDDDPVFLEALSTKITTAGFLVSMFHDPKQALSAISRQKPDLIILDMHVKKVSGIQMMNQLKSDSSTASLKVIFLTDIGTNEEGMEWIDQKFARDLGALDYIRRSDDWDKILVKIKHVLES